MRLPEQRLWDRVRDNMLVGMWAQRVENSLGAGMPDVVIIDKESSLQRTSWVELKVNENRPVRDKTPFLGKSKGLSAEQINWHMDCAQHGGKSWILAALGSKPSRQIILVSGVLAARINSMSVQEALESFARPSITDALIAIRNNHIAR